MNITALEILKVFSVVLFIAWFFMSVQMKDNIRNRVYMIGCGFVISLTLYFMGYFFLIAVGWFMSQIGIFLFNDLMYIAVYFVLVSFIGGKISEQRKRNK